MLSFKIANFIFVADLVLLLIWVKTPDDGRLHWIHNLLQKEAVVRNECACSIIPTGNSMTMHTCGDFGKASSS